MVSPPNKFSKAGAKAEPSLRVSADSLRADEGPARTTLRRHATGTVSARGLLLTVMGEFLLPSGGTAWTSTFIDALSRVGIEAGTTRQALARTAAASWLSSERLGRRTRWHLTAAGEQLLIEGTKRIYGFAGPAVDWDGRWLVVLASVPESDRASRHLLRSRLTWAGLGSPAPGIWVGTHADRLAEVEEVLDRAGIAGSAQVFIAKHAGRSPLASMVSQTWNLASIHDEYEGFIAEFTSTQAPDPLRRVIELVHAWRRFPWLDPALPRELLPEGWKGADAAALFGDRHERWTAAATEAWDRINREPRSATT